MKTKTKYTDEPMGEMNIVDDFLPPPDKLVLKEDHVKITHRPFKIPLNV